MSVTGKKIENLHCGNCVALYWTLLEWILIFHMDTTGFSIFFQHALSMYINNIRLKYWEKPTLWAINLTIIRAFFKRLD